jgi:predicted transposase/invertase (TIGR01784 family)
MKARYVNPYTDFGFKKLFGEEGSIDLLIDFLNGFLPIQHKIVHLSFTNTERLGTTAAERRAVFDLHCEDEKGGKFIVEMQKAKMKFFKDRAVFYSTFPIREQAEKGEWNLRLKPVYCVAILDFTFDDEQEDKECISNIQLKDQYCRVFYDKLTYIFIEMPRFQKGENELDDHVDKWLYFLKNLENFEDIPEILKEEVFIKGFEIAEIANFTPHQLAEYEESLKIYRDLKGVIDTSYEEGIEEGIQIGEERGLQKGEKIGLRKGKIEMARTMKKSGAPTAKIALYTGLSTDEINRL